MIKNSLLIIGLILACNSFVLAQKNCAQTTVTAVAINSTKTQIDEQDHPYGGTFQIIASKAAGKKEVFTTDLLTFVENNRLENEENILVLSPITKLRILSKKQISSANFHPIEKLYSFE